MAHGSINNAAVRGRQTLNIAALVIYTTGTSESLGLFHTGPLAERYTLLLHQANNTYLTSYFVHFVVIRCCVFIVTFCIPSISYFTITICMCVF